MAIASIAALKCLKRLIPHSPGPMVRAVIDVLQAKSNHDGESSSIKINKINQFAAHSVFCERITWEYTAQFLMKKNPSRNPASQ